MGKTASAYLPEDLEIFLRQLKSFPCSVDWDWKRILYILQSRKRYVSAFSSLIEAGIYHVLYSKQATKHTSLKCQDLHSASLQYLQLAGACFAQLFMIGFASKRCETSKNMLKSTVASLLDSILISFEMAGFRAESLQPIMSCKDLHIAGFQNPLALDAGPVDKKSRFQLALRRIDLLSSTLRSIFDCRLPAEIPICAPFLCNVIISTLSINHCDPRFVSTDLVACWRRLFHSFSSIFISCGANLVPASPAIITALVYQLEWSSKYNHSQSSTHALLHRLSIYNAITSIISTTCHFSSVVVGRLLSRILIEISADVTTFSNAFTVSPNLLALKDKNGILECEICIAMAALLLIEKLFSQHAYTFTRILADENAIQDTVNEDNCVFKIRISLVQLHSNLLSLVKNIISLLNEPQQSIRKLNLLQPSILIYVMKVVYSNKYIQSQKFKDLIQILLSHENIDVRSFASNVYNSISYCRNLQEKNIDEWNRPPEMDTLKDEIIGIRDVVDKSTEAVRSPYQILQDEVEVSILNESVPILPLTTDNLQIEEKVRDCQTAALETVVNPSHKRNLEYDDEIESKKIRLSDSIEDHAIIPPHVRADSIRSHPSEPLKSSELSSVDACLCDFDDTLA